MLNELCENSNCFFFKVAVSLLLHTAGSGSQDSVLICTKASRRDWCSGKKKKKGKKKESHVGGSILCIYSVNCTTRRTEKQTLTAFRRMYKEFPCSFLGEARFNGTKQ